MYISIEIYKKDVNQKVQRNINRREKKNVSYFSRRIPSTLLVKSTVVDKSTDKKLPPRLHVQYGVSGRRLCVVCAFLSA